jgi:CubicO group peptidase (beta-lactamase class C family)
LNNQKENAMIKNLIFLILFLSPIALNAQEKSETTEQFLAGIDHIIPRLLHDFSIPGAAIAIIEDGEIVFQKGYGFADIETALKIDTKTGFNIGSISKTVAAWGIMKLVQEGKIDLDAPAEKYLTRWHLPASEFDSDEVTVRRLLSHTAGLSIPSVSAGYNYDNLPTLEDWLSGKNDGLGPVEIIAEPGSKGEYSGGGYGVCQLIIEEVTGLKFEDYMQAQILDPLGMINSSYKIDDKIKAASASPYDRYGDATDFELFTVQAGAGLHTTLEDFTRFTFASLYQHQDNSTYNPVLTADMIQQMMEPVPNTKNWAWSYGMGYQVLEMGPLSGYRGHGGTNIGWQANFWVDPLSNDGFIVFTNGGASHISDLVFCRWVTWKSGASPWDACNPNLSIASKLKQIIDEKGIEDIGATYAALKKEQPDGFDFSEGQLNDLGYYYKGKGDLEKAISIFKINADAFPYAFNVFDSYGEALLAQGAREQAIENYKQSVKLNPDNENGIKVLNDLGESTEDLLFKVPIEHLELLEGEYLATHDEDWRIVVEVKNGVLKCEDKYYNFTLVPIGDDKFVNPRFGALWRFDTTDPSAKPTMLFGKYEFPKVK